jgi:hypothetical protein
MHAPPDGGSDMPLPAWPAYDHAAQDTTMVFGHMDGSGDDGTPAAVPRLKRKQCDFWDKVLGW